MPASRGTWTSFKVHSQRSLSTEGSSPPCEGFGQLQPQLLPSIPTVSSVHFPFSFLPFCQAPGEAAVTAHVLGWQQVAGQGGWLQLRGAPGPKLSTVPGQSPGSRQRFGPGPVRKLWHTGFLSVMSLHP